MAKKSLNAQPEVNEEVVFGGVAGGVLEEGSADNTDTATEDEETSVEGGEAQGRGMQITTTCNTGTIPQVDSSEFAYKVRHLMNGDIQEDDKSVVADKMVNEAKAFQLSKSVVNSFPEDGAAYLETLDFKVSH